MNSSAIRGIRRKKSSLSEVKVAVLGSPGVGKSALIVRCLCKKFIGEYDHQNENRYKHEIMVDGEPVIFEILDTCAKTGNELVSPDTLQWADGFLLVYSITDRQSFNYIKRIKQQLSEHRNVFTGGNNSNANAGGGNGGSPAQHNTLSVGPVSNNNGYRDNNSSGGSPCQTPVVLVGNKADMVHLRQISADEGEILAKDLDCSFTEVSASEQVSQVAEVFHEVCREVQAAKRKTKQSLLDRVLGNKAAAGLRVYARGKSDSALPKE